MNLPFVSCICVTKDRSLFLRQSISYFERARQDYKVMGGVAELVIVDSSERFLLPELGSHVRYLHVPTPTTRIGHLRNIAVSSSIGKIIMHWDDDDWHASNRIARQASLLMKVESAIAYSSHVYLYDLPTGRATRGPWWEQGGTAGTLLAYHRHLWEKTPFFDLDIGEDSAWWAFNEALGTQFIDSKEDDLSVYIRHHANWSSINAPHFTEEDTSAVREIMGKDVKFYDELTQILPIRKVSEVDVSESQARLLANFWHK